MPQRQQWRHQRISRRAFLRALTVTASGAFAAACGAVRGGEIEAQLRALNPQATPQIILPSPEPPTADGAPDERLAAFLALSSLLTGVDRLSPELGRLYLQSLDADAATGATVTRLLDAAGMRSETPPATLDALTATGIFDQEPLNRLAKQVAKLWYTGIYTNDAGEEIVATYVDALAWRTLRFTKPRTICGYPGFWAEAWLPGQPIKAPVNGL
ncbi:MAG: hypothetical protein H6644_11010 [Caldilineaceae bacterium]|nr:hypothetical protein [Caldilineaceae bacterium]